VEVGMSVDRDQREWNAFSVGQREKRACEVTGYLVED